MLHRVDFLNFICFIRLIKQLPTVKNEARIASIFRPRQLNKFGLMEFLIFDFESHSSKYDSYPRRTTKDRATFSYKFLESFICVLFTMTTITTKRLLKHLLNPSSQVHIPHYIYKCITQYKYWRNHDFGFSIKITNTVFSPVIFRKF